MQNDQSTKRSIRLSLDSRFIIGVLLVIIAILVVLWKPWEERIAANARTVDVTGTATVKAEPDEFVFYPSYEFTGTDKTKVLTELTAKSDEVVAKLKELGVLDSKIKTNSSGYDFPIYYPDATNPDEATYSLSLTVTIDDKDMAQKVQDYLVTTTPTGSVSPQSTFSETKTKELEDQARDEATKDARKKADKSAANLGFKVGEVKTVTDGAGFSGGCGGGLCGGYELSTTAVAADSSMARLSVQPGENELTYSVTVTYFIK